MNVFSTILSLEEGFPENEQLPQDKLLKINLNSYLEERKNLSDGPENKLLIFDQFEEILTTSAIDPSAKQVFFEQLGEALQNRHIWALFSIREDFIGGLAPYVRHIPNRFGVTFRLNFLDIEFI